MEYIRKIFLKLFCRRQWVLLYIFQKNNKPCFDLSSFSLLVPPKDRDWADPFVVYENGEYFVFFEEHVWAKKKGVISVIKLNPDGTYRSPVVVLEKAYHLSYPFIFKHNGTYYMLPETGINRSIELYKCTQFPYEWKYAMTLMNDIAANDTTLLYRDKHWWLFTNLYTGEHKSDTRYLFCYTANSLLTTNWRPHPANPLIDDRHTARSAGAFFQQDGRLYRPSQDCSREYGYALSINEVQVLTREKYKEKQKKYLPPFRRKIIGVHTFNHAQQVTVADANFLSYFIPRRIQFWYWQWRKGKSD